MSVWPFNRLHELNCIVKFGYFNPNDIAEIAAFERPNKPKDQEQLLVNSIKKEGVRNPLICVAYDGKDTYVTVGHHRLWAAKRSNTKQIPIIVNDFCNRYPALEVISSIEEARAKFKDQPNIVKSFRTGISTSEPLVNNETWWISK